MKPLTAMLIILGLIAFSILTSQWFEDWYFSFPYWQRVGWIAAGLTVVIVTGLVIKGGKK